MSYTKIITPNNSPSLANYETTEVTGLEKTRIKAEINTKLPNIDVQDMLLVPKLKTNLLTIARICDRRYAVIFKEQCA